MYRLVEVADESAPESLEVLSGLKVGDQVIMQPPSTLTEGAPIEVQLIEVQR